jgi:hypothetical protein
MAIRDSQKKTKRVRKVGEATGDRGVEGTGKAHTSNSYVNPFLSDSIPFSIAEAIQRPASSNAVWVMVVL